MADFEYLPPAFVFVLAFGVCGARRGGCEEGTVSRRKKPPLEAAKKKETYPISSHPPLQFEPRRKHACVRIDIGGGGREKEDEEEEEAGR